MRHRFNFRDGHEETTFNTRRVELRSDHAANENLEWKTARNASRAAESVGSLVHTQSYPATGCAPAASVMKHIWRMWAQTVD